MWQVLGQAAGTVGAAEPRQSRPGQAPDPAALAWGVGGGLLRALRLRPRVAGRRRPRGSPARLRDPTADHSSTRSSQVPRARDLVVRHATPDRGRVAPPLPRDPRGWPWVEGRDDDPWDVEAAGPPLEVRRTEAAPREHPSTSTRSSREARATRPGRPSTAPTSPGSRGSGSSRGRWARVPHCHSEEEEIFVILEGSATLQLWPSPRKAERGAQREQHELRPGPRRCAPARHRHLALLHHRR